MKPVFAILGDRPSQSFKDWVRKLGRGYALQWCHDSRALRSLLEGEPPPRLVLAHLGGITESDVGLLRDRVVGSDGITLVAVGSAPQQCSLAFRTGADGFILTCEPPESARCRLQAAVRGEMMLCAEAVASLQILFETYRIHTNAIAQTLSQRESEALALLCNGASLRRVAQQMGVTYNTAVTYVRRASGKVGAKSRVELTRFGFQIGIGRPQPSASAIRDNPIHAR